MAPFLCLPLHPYVHSIEVLRLDEQLIVNPIAFLFDPHLLADCKVPVIGSKYDITTGNIFVIAISCKNIVYQWGGGLYITLMHWVNTLPENVFGLPSE